MPERTKKTRGNYAKLICLQCRERRIKCMLPEDVDVQPSSKPQPVANSCQRCQQKGLDCIVRKTTLGRPNRKTQEPVTPVSTRGETLRSESPSANIEDLVLCNPDDVNSDTLESPEPFRDRSTSIDGQLSGWALAEGMDRQMDRTLSLVRQDDNFGRALFDLELKQPQCVLNVISDDAVAELDARLVWMRICLPHIPSLHTLQKQLKSKQLEAGTYAAANALFAMLCNIALDVPGELPSQMRQAQDALSVITYHSGRNMLFMLPQHPYALMVLEVIHSFRPLALVSGREPATHALTGKLYTTLGKTLASQLGLQHAPGKLRDIVDGRTSGDSRKLVYDTLQWCWWLMSEPRNNGDLKRTNPNVPDPEVTLEHALGAISDAYDREMGPHDALMAYHSLRYEADDLYGMRCLTRDWHDLEAMKLHLSNCEELLATRKMHFEAIVQSNLQNKGHTALASAFLELSKMKLNSGRANATGLAMFYAITGSVHKGVGGDGRQMPVPSAPFSKYFVECLSQHSPHNEWSPVGSFLEQFGDVQVEEIEARLAAFASVSSDVKLEGMPFMGPPRQLCCNIVFACKEIVENTAARIRLTKELHKRIDVHLILFTQAARCLESMEASGGTPEATARGSVLTASAKLIRTFHSIMLNWKRNYPIDKTQTAPSASNKYISPPQETFDSAQIFNPAETMTAMDWESMFQDNFFADWDSFQPMGGGEMPSLLGPDINLTMP